jgi:hypothetical protein
MALGSKDASSPSVNLHISGVKVTEGKAFVGYNNTTYNTYNTYKGYHASFSANHYIVFQI